LLLFGREWLRSHERDPAADPHEGVADRRSVAREVGRRRTPARRQFSRRREPGEHADREFLLLVAPRRGLLEIAPLPGVEIIQGDFTDDAVLAQIDARLGGRKVDLVLSDMAPNISGIALMDQARAVNLAEMALDFARGRLAPEGAFLVKTFQGAGYPDFRAQMMDTFRTVASRKPAASRDRSSEQFLLGRQLKAAAGG
jgi:hypothetical protein